MLNPRVHGEGFAVGFVVIDQSGVPYDSGLFACDPENAQGTPEDAKCVRAHVPTLSFTHQSPIDVREAFWHNAAQ